MNGAVTLQCQAADPGIARKPGGGNLVGEGHYTPNTTAAQGSRYVVFSSYFRDRPRGSRDAGQMSSSTHSPHRGFFASHTRRP